MRINYRDLFRSAFFLTCLCWVFSVELMAQYSGYKGDRWSASVHTLVSSFPPTILGLFSEIDIKPEINPELRLEFAMAPKLSLGVHFAYRNLGFPYRHKQTFGLRLSSDPWFQEYEILPGSYHYHWFRYGVDFYQFRHGYLSPVGKYFVYSLQQNVLVIKDPTQDLSIFEGKDTMASKSAVTMIGFGFGNRRVIFERYWISAGGSLGIRLPFQDHFRTSDHNPELISYLLNNQKQDPNARLNLAIRQLMAFNLTISFGILW